MLRLIHYDTVQGFRRNCMRWVFTFIILLLLMLAYVLTVRYLPDSVLEDHEEIHFLDVLMYFFHGAIAHDPKYKDGFSIPAVWLILQVLLHFLLASYPLMDIHDYGLQVLIRTRKKAYWWISKCIWCIASVLFFYVLIWFMAGVVSILNGFSLKIALHQRLTECLYFFDPSGLHEKALVFQLIIMPVLVSAATGIVQAALMFYISVPGSYILVISWLFLSALIISPVFLGNFSMASRNSLISGNSGLINSSQGPFFCLAFIVIGLFAGSWKINRYEIL